MWMAGGQALGGPEAAGTVSGRPHSGLPPSGAASPCLSTWSALVGAHASPRLVSLQLQAKSPGPSLLGDASGPLCLELPVGSQSRETSPRSCQLERTGLLTSCGSPHPETGQSLRVPDPRTSVASSSPWQPVSFLFQPLTPALGPSMTTPSLPSSFCLLPHHATPTAFSLTSSWAPWLPVSLGLHSFPPVSLFLIFSFYSLPHFILPPYPLFSHSSDEALLLFVSGPCRCLTERESPPGMGGLHRV